MMADEETYRLDGLTEVQTMLYRSAQVLIYYIRISEYPNRPTIPVLRCILWATCRWMFRPMYVGLFIPHFVLTFHTAGTA